MKTQLKSASRTILAVALATAAISISSAQGHRDGKIKSFNTTMEGRGTVHFDGADHTFRMLQLTVQDNQRVTVHALMGGFDNRDVVFSGRVSNVSRRSGRLSADMDNVGSGRDSNFADALCDVDMSSNDTFRTVTITGRNKSDHNSVALDFVSNGHVVTDYQPDRGDMNGQNRGGRNGGVVDRNHNGRDDRSEATGQYSETEEWRRNGQHFVLRYSLSLTARGEARLLADSIEDRNMPSDKDARQTHGDILKYLHSGQNVVETGIWGQDGDRITITFDQIQYGNTSRSKKEVWRGHLRGEVLSLDSFEKSFYGHNVDLTFNRN